MFVYPTSVRPKIAYGIWLNTALLLPADPKTDTSPSITEQLAYPACTDYSTAALAHANQTPSRETAAQQSALDLTGVFLLLL